MKISKLLLSTIMLLCILSAYSQTPASLRNLVGSDATNLDDDMYNKGYVHIRTSNNTRDHFCYFWNHSAKKCVSTKTSSGRINSIRETSTKNCNKSGYDNGNHLSQKHHSGENRQNQEDASIAYDKGYLDGLNAQRQQNTYRSMEARNAYKDGYRKGYDLRNKPNASEVEFMDLDGKTAKFAYAELKQRGFIEQKKHSSGSKTYRLWYNASTDQCVKTTSSNKKISNILVSTNCN